MLYVYIEVDNRDNIGDFEWDDGNDSKFGNFNKLHKDYCEYRIVYFEWLYETRFAEINPSLDRMEKAISHFSYIVESAPYYGRYRYGKLSVDIREHRESSDRYIDSKIKPIEKEPEPPPTKSLLNKVVDFLANLR